MRINSPVSALAVFIAAAVAVGLIITFVRGETTPPRSRAGQTSGAVTATAAPPQPSTPPQPSPPRSTTPPRPTGPAATVVKIDNVAAARPQTGLGSAEIIYVEPVEGGLTRLAAVYFGEPPTMVGPVRSARQSDIELLAQFGTPTLAYSGVAPELIPLLHDADLRLASPAQDGAAYFRSSRGAAPHNLYVDASALPAPAAPVTDPILEFGSAPEGGTAINGYSAHYRSASFSFFWSAEAGRWLISMNGTPMTSTESGRLAASTVVIQRVPVGDGLHIVDASGALSPVVGTVGSGPATVLRDGMKFTGIWARPHPDAPTRYTTVSGEPLPLAEGPVWVLLVPR